MARKRGANREAQTSNPSHDDSGDELGHRSTTGRSRKRLAKGKAISPPSESSLLEQSQLLDKGSQRKVCEIEPLDAKCLDRMGLVEKHDGAYRFFPPRECSQPLRRVSRLSQAHMDDQEEDIVSLRLGRIERRLERMETNLYAFFRSVGFHPPYPPSP